MGARESSGRKDRGPVRDDVRESGSATKKKASTAKPKQKPKSEVARTVPTAEYILPVELQQLLLNIFKDSFPETLGLESFQTLLQDVKTALYERDFRRAFGKPGHLEAYAIRWSPSRALCYASIMIDIRKYLGELSPTLRRKTGSRNRNLDSLSLEDHSERPLRAICFGGGAAEIVAFGGFLRYLDDTSRGEAISRGDTATATAATIRDAQTFCTPNLGDISETTTRNEGETVAVVDIQSAAKPLNVEVLATETPQETSGFLSLTHEARIETVPASLFEDAKTEETSELAPVIEESKAEAIPAPIVADTKAERAPAPASSLPVLEKVPMIDLVLHDEAQWQDAIQRLDQSLTATPPLPKYANASVKEKNRALIEQGSLVTSFLSDDVLELERSRLQAMIGEDAALLTLLFTLNELYTTSIPKTTAFLLNLTLVTKPGTLLLVVDSPGSYSELAALGKEAKKYPMSWLLNHTLVEGEGEEKKVSPDWVKVISEESHWFRLPATLRYPIPLENMRYQMHLYRRL